jgi:hypothetical protein
VRRQGFVAFILAGLVVAGCSHGGSTSAAVTSGQSSCAFGDGFPSLATSWTYPGADCSLDSQVPSEVEIESGCTSEATFDDGTNVTGIMDWAPHMFRSGVIYHNIALVGEVSLGRSLLAYQGACGRSTGVFVRVETISGVDPQDAFAERVEDKWSIYANSRSTVEVFGVFLLMPRQLREAVFNDFIDFQMDVIHLRGL